MRLLWCDTHKLWKLFKDFSPIIALRENGNWDKNASLYDKSISLFLVFFLLYSQNHLWTHYMFLLFAGGVCSFSYQEIRMALAEKRKIFGHNKVKWKINFAHCTIFVIWFFYNHIKRVKCEKKGIFQTHFWSIPDIEGKCEFRKPLRSQMTKTPVLFSRQIPESGLDSRYMTAWTNALVQLKMGESLLLLLRARFWEENLSEKNSLPPFFCRKKSSPLQKKSIRPPYFTWKKVFAPLNTAMKTTLFIVSIILQWTHQNPLTQHRLLFDLQKCFFLKN